MANAVIIEDQHSLGIRTAAHLAGPVESRAQRYPAGYQVMPHRHDVAQMLYAREGLALVSTSQGRWMLPPDHALWVPPGIEHSVEMLVQSTMLSFLMRGAGHPDLPQKVTAVAVSELARALIKAAADPDPGDDHPARRELVMPLLLDVIATLPQRPLALPLPSDPKLAELCRRFVEAPTAALPIDGWANRLSMSRRSFTRAFRRETGLSLSTWRQQALLFAALPRLADGEPVTHVALDLGYDSISAFTTMFKRMLGAPPREYFRTGRSG